MIIQSTQTQLYVMFTWRPWFLWDQRFAFIEWFCLLYPVRRIPDHTAFALVGIHKFIWASECVFKLDSYLQWWYCSRYQFGFPDSDLFKSHFMSSCITYYSVYICLLDLVIRKLVTFCPLGTEDCSQGSKDPCDRYKPLVSFSSFFLSSDESI